MTEQVVLPDSQCIPHYKPLALQVASDMKLPGASALEFLHIPVEVYRCPSDEELLSLLKAILKALEEGKKVYIHCMGGHGRSGIVSGCLLGILYNLDADGALELLTKLHGCRKIVKSKTPESLEQEEQIRRMLAALKVSYQTRN
eukprot:TRINITY_DN6770_c0_g1_i1.p1 TRINITY_DN6770_c0_g1~~TRINITY_DN6770_c0_g1_i1.p1  ORF type:complete len:144 (+),score=21.16 TRINITY_DN6770_c0_g1_i1:388-819(+)